MNSNSNFWRIAISCLLVAGIMSCEVETQNNHMGSEKALTGTCAETNTIMAGVIDENAAGLDTFFLELYHYPIARIGSQDSILWEDGIVLDSAVTTDRTFSFDLKSNGHHTLVVYYQGEEVGRMDVSDLKGPELKVVSVPVFYKPQNPEIESYRFVYADHIGNDSVVQFRLNSKFFGQDFNQDAQHISFYDYDLARVTIYHQNDSGFLYTSEFTVDKDHEVTYISKYKLPNSIQGPGEWTLAVYSSESFLGSSYGSLKRNSNSSSKVTYEEGDTLLLVVQNPAGFTDEVDFAISYSGGKLWSGITAFKFPNAQNGEFKWVIPKDERPLPHNIVIRAIDPSNVNVFAQSENFRIISPRIISPIGMMYVESRQIECIQNDPNEACPVQFMTFYADTNLVRQQYQYISDKENWGSYSLWGIDSIKTRFGDEIEWYRIEQAGRQLINEKGDTLKIAGESVRTFK